MIELEVYCTQKVALAESPVHCAAVSSAKTALIVWGGWEGHQPKQAAELFSQILNELGFAVDVQNTLDAFVDYDAVRSFNLIVPIWTMGRISQEQAAPVLKAVSDDGVGIAGSHGGMCDAFRECTEWQFLTGGQWVAHPGDDKVRYQVNITQEHEITRGLQDFEVTSEQYYMHVDPAVNVLASTTFPIADGPHVPNGEVRMPVVWTKRYGQGRVFYCSIGHCAHDLQVEPVRTLMKRGMAWAARA